MMVNVLSRSDVVPMGAVFLPNNKTTKTMDVTITILSLNGVHIKDVGKKRAKSDSPTMTNIVASFSHDDLSTNTTSCLPSLSLDIPKSSNKNKPINEVIYWPDQDETIDDDVIGLSSFQFQRDFVHEGQSSRFVPQPCSIQLAISRKGKLHALGSANILVSGEENGEASINIPIANHDGIPKSKVGQPSNSSRRFSIVKNKADVPMAKLKGDSIKCGLDGNATLRVLVRVSEVDMSNTQTPSFEVQLNTSELSPSFSSNVRSVLKYDSRLNAMVRKFSIGETQQMETAQLVERDLLNNYPLKRVDDGRLAPSISTDVQSIGDTVTTAPDYISVSDSNKGSLSTVSSIGVHSSSTQDSGLSTVVSQTGVEIIPFVPTATPSDEESISADHSHCTSHDTSILTSDSGKRSLDAMIGLNIIKVQMHQRLLDSLSSQQSTTVSNLNSISTASRSTVLGSKGSSMLTDAVLERAHSLWNRHTTCGSLVCQYGSEMLASAVTDADLFTEDDDSTVLSSRYSDLYHMN